MQKHVAMALSAAALALAGCGDSTCDTLSDAAQALSDKAASCSLTPQTELFDEDACENAYDALSSDAQNQADDLADQLSDCVDNLSNCEPGQEAQWAQDAANCTQGLTLGEDDTTGS